MWGGQRLGVLTVGGYSYDEIAAQLGVTYTNVNRHLVRARAAVHNALAPE